MRASSAGAPASPRRCASSRPASPRERNPSSPATPACARPCPPPSSPASASAACASTTPPGSNTATSPTPRWNNKSCQVQLFKLYLTRLSGQEGGREDAQADGEPALPRGGRGAGGGGRIHLHRLLDEPVANAHLLERPARL